MENGKIDNVVYNVSEIDSDINNYNVERGFIIIPEEAIVNYQEQIWKVTYSSKTYNFNVINKDSVVIVYPFSFIIDLFKITFIILTIIALLALNKMKFYFQEIDINKYYLVVFKKTYHVILYYLWICFSNNPLLFLILISMPVIQFPLEKILLYLLNRIALFVFRYVSLDLLKILNNIYFIILRFFFITVMILNLFLLANRSNQWINDILKNIFVQFSKFDYKDDINLQLYATTIVNLFNNFIQLIFLLLPILARDSYLMGFEENMNQFLIYRYFFYIVLFIVIMNGIDNFISHSWSFASDQFFSIWSFLATFANVFNRFLVHGSTKKVAKNTYNTFKVIDNIYTQLIFKFIFIASIIILCIGVIYCDYWHLLQSRDTYIYGYGIITYIIVFYKFVIAVINNNINVCSDLIFNTFMLGEIRKTLYRELCVSCSVRNVPIDQLKKISVDIKERYIGLQFLFNYYNFDMKKLPLTLLSAIKQCDMNKTISFINQWSNIYNHPSNIGKVTRETLLSSLKDLKPLLKNVHFNIEIENGRYTMFVTSNNVNYNIKFDRPFIAVVKGPTGSGKTTIMDAMAGLILNKYVKINNVPVDNVEITSLGKKLINIPQADMFVDGLSLRENLNMFGIKYVESLIDFVKILNIEKILFENLDKYMVDLNFSGGELKRLSILRFIGPLVSKAFFDDVKDLNSIIIYDEVCSSFDQQTQEELIDIFNQIRNYGCAQFFIEHLGLMSGVADIQMCLVPLDGDEKTNTLEFYVPCGGQLKEISTIAKDGRFDKGSIEIVN